MSKKRRLFVILASQAADRGTESHFTDLFEDVIQVWPHWSLAQTEEFSHGPFCPGDTLLFEGGTDISPYLYGEIPIKGTQKSDDLRDQHEVKFFNEAHRLGAGFIGICRGAQLLCALSGGHIIQHVTGHNEWHKMQLPDRMGKDNNGNSLVIGTTSAHHQMMNPYRMNPKEWVSYGHSFVQRSERYYTEKGRFKPGKSNRDWREQEIIWFPKTRSLAIQGHPEYYIQETAPFVRYCRYLIITLLLTAREK